VMCCVVGRLKYDLSLGWLSFCSFWGKLFLTKKRKRRELKKTQELSNE